MQFGIWTFSIILGLSAAWEAHARKLEVGPGKAYLKPSSAAAAAQPGDTIELAATVYSGDACTWNDDNLVIRGVSKYAHLKADGAAAQGKGTWVITGRNCKVENIEFSGAKVPDLNGAGIRSEGAGLHISRCYFHDNENGILTGAADGDIVIEYSEFASNGYGDGFTHNMYIGRVASFTLRHCYTHRARIGHNIKSRALKNRILYNLSIGGTDGTGSYELDLPNGGESYVIGNIFQQGPATDNPVIFAYGAEGLSNAGSALYVVNNTFINDRQAGTFIRVASSPTASKVLNNLFVGPGTMISGNADTSGNLLTASPGFANRAAYDYRLTAASPAIDKGKDPGLSGDFNLTPTLQYVHPSGGMARPVKGALDVGAFELEEGAPVSPGKKARKAPDRGRRSGVGARWLAPLPGSRSDRVDALGKDQG